MANTAPSLSLGQVPSVADWQNYFNAKVDAANGALTNPTLTGGTISGAFSGSPTWTGLHTFSGGVSISTGTASLTRFSSDPSSGQLIIGGTSADGQGINWLWGRMRWTATITGSDPLGDGQAGANKIIFSDAASVSGANNSSALYIMNSQAGNTASSNTASRNTIHSRIIVQGQVGPSPTLGPTITNIPYVSHLSTGYGTVAQGGLGGWSAGNNPSTGYYRGSLFGGNDNVWLTTGASNWFYLVGREIDVSIQGTASVYSRFGLLISGFTSTSQADDDDAAIAIVTQTVDGKNFKNGLQFGANTAPLDISGALIKVVSRRYPSPATPALTDGIDISAATFSGNAIKTPGFTVDGSGNVSATNSRKVLYITGTSVGNGADLTADTLQTFTIPANTLKNVGDIIHVVAGGIFAASTDTKTAAIKFGATSQVTITATTTSAVRWYGEVWFMKTGTNTQSYTGVGAQVANSSGTNSATTTLAEGSTIALTVVGQNSTNSVANSVTCQLLMVEYIPSGA